MRKSENNDTPILNAVMAYANSKPVAFHMPGHKLGKGFDIDEFKSIGKFDLTEIPGTDNLHFPEEAIAEAMKLASEAFGAEKTYFLVNGSTCGIHAAIMTLCKRGDRLIVSRDCHKSVIGGLLLAGAEPVYVKPCIEKSMRFPLGCDADAMIKAIDENSDAAGIFITRPSYYGTCCDIQRLVEHAHKKGMAVIVDEAHGAHLRFSPDLPVCAMDANADLCIQSTHKTLSAFTQTALLHVKGNLINRERLEFFLRLLETSSPSYLFLCSIDYARSIMENEGYKLLSELKKNVDEFEEEFRDNEYYIVNRYEDERFSKDFTRLVINTSKLGISGYEMEGILRKEFNIQVEMSDYSNIVCILTVSDSEADMLTLSSALKKIEENYRKDNPLTDINISEFNIPQKSVGIDGFIPESEFIELSLAIGRISADIVTPYPPGIPLLCPGEIIMEELTDILYNIVKAGGRVNGLTPDGCIKVIKQQVNR